MTAAETVRVGRNRRRERSPLQRAVRIGIVFGVVAVYIAVVGILPLMNSRWIVVDVLSLGDAALLAIGLGAGAAVAARRSPSGYLPLAFQSFIAGGLAGSLLALLTAAMSFFDLRRIFIALSPALLQTLTFDLGVPLGPVLVVGAGALLAVLGAGLSLGPRAIGKPILVGFAFVLFFGVFQELIQIMMQFGTLVSDLREAIFTWEGLSPTGALAIFALASGGTLLWTGGLRKQVHGRISRLTTEHGGYVTAVRILIGVLLLLLFPVVAGQYIGQVMMLVGLYLLMGMGLNLEVGLAGLLDLGFVAFFAVGAYVTALLTADSPHALANYTMLPSFSYWAAMPIAIVCSVIVGVLFGIPVLGVRGDYLAVATMGLGEIVRVIVQSDAAAPLLAGAQGILQIPKPRIGSFELSDPVDLFYLTLAASAVAAYCAWRLENSRLGRAWMAVRDDEDVAQALGINLVKVKLLAYGLGAGFAGLAGSIFAVMLTSIYPSSFQLLISINVLALIIVGGMGSLPGVVVGALALVGLPELLREFGEYRYLFYGAALIIMMRIRPEGLWPSVRRRRELDITVAKPATVGGAAEPAVTPSLAFEDLRQEKVEASAEPILATRRLTMRFGGLTAVGELDLNVRERAIHSIIGPNGAGKTTLFNCIMQNLPITAGQIWFRGERVDGLTPDRVAASGISRTYQNIRLFRNITALENLLVGMHLHLNSHWWGALLNTPHTRRDEQRAHEHALKLLQFVGLKGRGDVLARDLAYGEQRRLEIGRALATRPTLLMLDEPTAGMNPRETSEMMAFVQNVRESFGITILLIEHQMRVVMTMSDVVTVLDHGAKIAEGSPLEIQNNSKVIEAYLGRPKAAPAAAVRHAIENMAALSHAPGSDK